VYMCTVLLPPGGYPIAVKYIISYHIKMSKTEVAEESKHTFLSYMQKNFFPENRAVY